MQTSEVLNLAADEIQVRGWGRGAVSWMGEGPVCIEGAIAAAARANPLDRPAFMACPAYKAVEAFLGNRLDSVYMARAGLFRWNDTNGRTATEVIAVLRATALIEAARERQSEQAAAR